MMYYLHLLGLPLEQMVLHDLTRHLQDLMCLWYCSYSERFLPRQTLWHPSRLLLYGHFHTHPRYSRLKRRRTQKRLLSLLAYATLSGRHHQALAYASTSSGHLRQLDSDSKPWLIENCLTACISNNKGDFVGTSLLHATARWPRAINTHLWPYALRTANDVIISTPKRLDGKSALGLFSGSDVIPKLRLLRPFGCPVYVLHTALAGDNHLRKWDQRARIGIYLGISPIHARSVALVLNTRTGLVSPQFHVKFDDMFETVAQSKETHPILWQTATHFTH